jgi:hypothetical protein
VGDGNRPLSATELDAFRAWFAEFDAAAWKLQAQAKGAEPVGKLKRDLQNKPREMAVARR